MYGRKLTHQSGPSKQLFIVPLYMCRWPFLLWPTYYLLMLRQAWTISAILNVTILDYSILYFGQNSILCKYAVCVTVHSDDTFSVRNCIHTCAKAGGTLGVPPSTPKFTPLSTSKSNPPPSQNFDHPAVSSPPLTQNFMIFQQKLRKNMHFH